ncbi:hypothetical protein AAHA92_33154 [Salvia divinorum]|uniref:Uncharacterized protein n=1 Tax=Salvia divinorum TaxID=28513 RepID=A0ABD1FP10_SALDI
MKLMNYLNSGDELTAQEGNRATTLAACGTLVAELSFLPIPRILTFKVEEAHSSLSKETSNVSTNILSTSNRLGLYNF